MSRITLTIVAPVVVAAAVVIYAVISVEEAQAPLERVEAAVAETGVGGESAEEKVKVLADHYTSVNQALRQAPVGAGTPPEQVTALVNEASGTDQALRQAGVAGTGMAQRVQALVAERDRLQQQVAAAQTRIQTLESAVASGEGSAERLTLLSEAHDRLSAELASARGELDRTRNELERAQGRLAQVERALDTARRERDAAREAANAARRERDAVRGELKKARNQASTPTATAFATRVQQGEVDRVASKMNDELIETRRDNERLQGENERLTGEVREARAQVANLETERAEREAKNRADALKRPFTIYFGFNNAVLTPGDRTKLADAAAAAKAAGAREILVIGNSDTLGPEDYNAWLSSIRADAVIAGLQAELAKQGIENVEIRKRVNGEDQLPVATPDETGEEENRRVDIRLEIVQ
ncbi:MAG: OmpA family protein [Alphaproteobacteria bacterium]|nr:OmpA family protein [Alphaproteobacteria bacterium]